MLSFFNRIKQCEIIVHNGHPDVKQNELTAFASIESRSIAGNISTFNTGYKRNMLAGKHISFAVNYLQNKIVLIDDDLYVIGRS